MKHFILIWLSLLLINCSSTPDDAASIDPWEGGNRKIDRFNDKIDRMVLKPVANGYIKVTPKPVRTSIGHFFSNISYPAVMINDFLQGKGEQGLADTARFMINSTGGVLGLFDVATALGLESHDEDFGQTLGVWGVARGLYLVIPFTGPNTARNLPDFAVSNAFSGLSYITSASLFIPLTIVKIIDKRASLSDVASLRDTAALDSYSFTRDGYLQRREYLLYDGNPPLSDDFD